MKRRKSAIAVNLISVPGGGKGTTAKMLRDRDGFSHFDMGPTLKQIRQKDSHLHGIMQRTTDQGYYVPDDTMLPILRSVLQKDLPDRVVIDGVLRTKAQSELMLEALHRQGFRVVTLNFHIPPDHYHECRKRMLDRNRADETPEMIEVRLEEFDRHNPDVLTFCESWENHFYRQHDGLLEPEERYRIVKMTLADAPTRRVRSQKKSTASGLVSYRPPDSDSLPSNMVCSGH